MDWLTVGATLDDHRYTLSRGLTLLAVGGALVSVVAAVVVARRTRPAPPRGPIAPIVATLALPASLLAAAGSSSTATIASLFPGTYHLDLAALAIAGLAAIVVAFRTRSTASLAIVLPGWLLSQCGLAHARSMHEPLPRITTKETQTVQIGQAAEPKWGVSEPGYHGVGEVPLAPRARGEHAYVACAQRDGEPIRVERTLRYQAVEERGDPLFPLRVGNRWLLRSEDGRAEMTIAVASSQVENGIRWYEVTVRAEGRNGSGAALSANDTRRLYEADGRILDHDGKPVLQGQHLTLERAFACECTETTAPPTRLLAGPVRCHWRHTNHHGLVALALATVGTIVTLGKADTSALEAKVKTEVTDFDLALVRSETQAEGSTK